MALKSLLSKGIGGGAGSLAGGAVMGPVGSVFGAKIGSDAGAGGLKNLLMGKDVVNPQDEIAPYLKETALRASQAQRGGLESLMAQSPAQLAQSKMNMDVQAQRANLEDQRKQIQQMVARRGLQNTSVGLGSLLGAERGAGKNISNILASQPLYERDFANQLIDAGAKVSSAQNVPIRFQDEVTRKQGILPLLTTLGGTAVGGYYGGAKGAQVGSQVGGSTGYGLSSIFG